MGGYGGQAARFPLYGRLVISAEGQMGYINRNGG